jgi:V/A-type H+/Na+-transporting ATPase subunit I
MIFPEKMVRLSVVGPKSVLERTIRELYSLKVLHIIDHTKGELDIGLPLQKADELSGLLVTVRALKGTLGIEKNPTLSNGFRAAGVKNFRELSSTIRLAGEEVMDRKKAIASFRVELKALQAKSELLTKLSGIDVSLENYKPYKSVACFLGTVSDTKGLHQKISEITDSFELFISSSGYELRTIALFIDKQFAQKAWVVLQSHTFSELDLSILDKMSGKPSSHLASILEKETAARKKLASAEGALAKTGGKWKDFLLLSERFLSMELEKAEVPLKFASTKNIFVVTGWVPQKKSEFVTQQLMTAGKGKLSIETKCPEENDAVPAMLDNPGQTKPFEFFLRLYAIPHHSEIDPTVFLAVTFPLFFGFILGDIGYGIVLLALFLYMMKKLPAMRDLLAVMSISAVSSIIFGFVYGEFFGAEELFGHELPRLLNRATDIVQLMLIAIGIGVVQLNFGYVLGFINVLKAHGLKHAILEKVSWVLLEVGIAIVALPIIGINVIPVYAGYAIIAISLVMIWMGEQIRGIVEIPGLFSNVLSYSRLMAVGVASVSLAVVVNDFAKGFFAKGGIFIAAAVLLLLTGHTINIVLGILGGFLHSTRLHYVEFFGKFFKGGATPYRPFGDKQ